ncbi:hypothetical protein F4802DRAFT_607882 [Xylaria palmicola]|nr:hypothetical protein F4802DRAFT_607882 [Xylaria palmicola]
MEALAAVGLAANVLQFVDFTQSLITGTIELHSSLKSARAEHLVLEDITQQLKQFAQRLLVPEAYEEENLSEDDLALKNLATQCIKISNELLSALHGLKVKSGSNILESFYRSLKGEWKKDEIKYLQLKLDRINQHITSRLLPSQISRMEGRLKNMMVQDRHLQARRSGDIDKLATELKLFMEELRSGETRKMPMSSLSAVVEKGTGYLAEQVILKCLRFESINNRHTSIPHAHHETFRWAFDDSAPAELVQWLRGNGLLYWISGKPGSGKSTFMKHLSRHHDTIKCLRDWANGEKLITADFFFWNADKNSLAKSQEGLLRSIMYQILRELPSQISQVFPDQWSMILSGISSRFEVCQHVQTPEELRRALARLTAHLPNTSSKFCLFIDGLDEYEGRPSDIIQAIKLLRLENVKLCVSSRSWNEFEHFFEDASGKLYMQDLTKEDIRLYVSDTFEQNPQFKDLVASEGRGRSEELVQDIIEAAQGVFLWVVLVVRSLLEGLDNADKFIYLKKRLREFPRDLDTFFERILFTVDEFYRGQTFPMFLTTLAACDLLPVMCYWFIDQLHDDANYAIELAVKPLTMQQIYIRRKTMGKRLNAYCKGLLEVQFVRTGQDDSLSSSILFDSRVDFLHRTARDFLRTPSAQLQLQNQLRPDFNAELTICHAILAQLKTIPQDKQLFASVGPVSNLLYLFFYHATALEDDGIPPETELQLITHTLTISI